MLRLRTTLLALPFRQRCSPCMRRATIPALSTQNFVRMASTHSWGAKPDRKPAARRTYRDSNVREDSAEDRARQRSKTIRVQNLPLETTEDELHNLFVRFGPVREVLIRPAHDGANFKRATVQFGEPDHTDAAIDSHNKEHLSLHGVELFVRYGSFTKLNEPSTTLFIGNLTPGATEEDIRDLLKAYANIKSIRMNKRGFAHVAFNSIDDAKAVIEAHEAYPMRDRQKRLIRLNYDHRNPPWRVLCLSGFEGTAEELEEVFEKHACNENIVRVSTFSPPAQQDRPPRPPLYFVEYPDIETAIKVRDTLHESPIPLGFHVEFGRKAERRRTDVEDEV